ncbi:hypothetical protein STANM309S_05379 [Streptomyces tanashiensis]
MRDLVRDGDLAPADYLEFALAHLPEETELALVQGVLGFARTQIADRYVAEDERPAALAAIGEIARALLRRTEDGEAPDCASPPSAPASTAPPPPTRSPPGSTRAPSTAARSSTPNCAGGSSPASPSSAPPTRP